MKYISKLSLVQKFIQNNELMSKQIVKLTVDSDVVIYANYNIKLVGEFKRSKKWECELTDTGYITITRKKNRGIRIILW